MKLTAMAIVKARYRFSRAVFHGGIWGIWVGSIRKPLGIGVTEARAWRHAASKISRGHKS